MNISETIKNMRLSRGLTQSALAVEMRTRGLSTNQETVSRWESGRKIPSDVALSALSGVLECVFELPDYVAVMLRRSTVALIDRTRVEQGADLTRAAFVALVLESWPKRCDDVDDATETEDGHDRV